MSARHRLLVGLVICGFGSCCAFAQSVPPDAMQPVGVGFGGAPPPAAPDPLQDPQYREAVTSQFPMTAGQIGEAKQIAHEVNQAIATPAGGAPQPKIETISVPLSPGANVPVIHLSAGNITTLVFQDDTGAPWPVAGVFTAPDAGVSVAIEGNDLIQDGGGGKGQAGPSGATSQAAIDTSKLTRTSSNVVILTPTATDIVGKNLQVALLGFNVPLAFTLDAGSGEVVYRTNITVPADGPNSAVARPDMPSIDTGGIQNFVDGVPPSGAQALNVSNPSIQVWLYKGQMYVRAQEDLAWPYLDRRQAATGQYVYVLRPSPIFDVSYNGGIEEVSVTDLPPAYEYAGAGGGQGVPGDLQSGEQNDGGDEAPDQTGDTGGAVGSGGQ